MELDFDNSRDYKVSDLSRGLFWDVDVKRLNWLIDAPLIVERVLQYGKVLDWRIILNIFGINKITRIAMQIRSLDPVTLSFISYVSGKSPEEFRCCIEKQSNQTLWNS